VTAHEVLGVIVLRPPLGDRALRVAAEELPDDPVALGQERRGAFVELAEPVELVAGADPEDAAAVKMIIRSAMVKALSISWVTTTLVTPSFRVRSRMSWSISALVTGSRPAEGSS